MHAIDLQLNGYKGVDFNGDDLTLESLRRACSAVRADGGGTMLATVITDRLDRMIARISRLAAFREADATIRDVVAGIHVEGPFISPLPGYVGAHPREHVIPATPEAAAQLIDAGRGLVRLLTLAPEHDAGLATTRWLADRGIVVSAGHCDPTLDQLARGVDAGLSAFTHLGNGCPLSLHRHDNIIQRALATTGLRWIMFVADGVHVPAAVLGNFLRLAGLDRAIAVTDATAAAAMGPGRYRLAGMDVVVDADGAAWAADRSHLVGSTATMRQVREFLAASLAMPPADIDRLTAVNPSRLLESCGALTGSTT
jgi:N-acetylglucosamine-6-phosphate deacetylase